MSFKLTYASMFNPPEELHARFEAAMAAVERGLGARHVLHLGGADVAGAGEEERRSPIDQRRVLGRFPLASAAQARAAVDAAHAAFPAWRRTPVAERVRLLKRVAELIEERVHAIAAALVLEVGKNRMEALGEIQETADFFRLYAEEFEQRNGFDNPLPDDPLEGWVSHNRSVMRPHGAWCVIAPFNFPFALAGGPVAAALVTGNTVVFKSATDTPWSGRLLADCLRDAGFPKGVFHYLNGSGAEVGQALVEHPRTAGITFTGSFDVGMRIHRSLANGPWPRPCIAEMGGKNPCLVTARADLERAATGIVRSAYGMGGQKCSALSRLYVDDAVADDLVALLRERIRAITLGDPAKRENWLGPVTTRAAVENYGRYAAALAKDGARLLEGGRRLDDGELAHGFYVAPTLAEAPATHPLYRQEMFLPILMLCRVRDREQAMALANDSPLGLTAGVYGDEDDIAFFHDHIEAGVTYANRPQGATTGAWPGYQPFGGWKGSGSTGKAIASFYYLQLYQREQSRTVVE